MAGYRQCFAMCFCLFAFEAAKERKLIKYLLFMVIAASMHLSALIFLPVYWGLKIRSGLWGTIFAIIILIALFLLEPLIISIGAELSDKQGSYTDVIQFSLVGFSIQIIIMLSPFMLDLLNLSLWTSNEQQWHYSILFLLSLGLMFYISRFVSNSFERVSYYYSFFIVAALPNSIARISNKNNGKYLISTIVVLFFIGLIIWRMPMNLQFFF